jgi:5'-nucleotidase
MTKPLVLLTNDDGFYSRGIEALALHLEKEAQIYIVAPDQERSATSLAINLHRPLRVKNIRENVYAVDGTPADCVYLAVQKILPRKPDFLISGINRGPNLGQQDISYSGTVAGALQGSFLQIPSIAVSVHHNENGEFHYDHAVKICLSLMNKILKNSLPEGTTLNINIPPPPIKGIKLVKLGQKRYNPEISERHDPRNRIYYWIGTGNPKAIGDGDSDVMVIKEGYVTITPLHKDLTDYKILRDREFIDIFSATSNEDI